MSNIDDNNDAWWHQIELENRQRFEEALKRHERINRESLKWVVELLKPEHTHNERKDER